LRHFLTAQGTSVAAFSSGALMRDDSTQFLFIEEVSAMVSPTTTEVPVHNRGFIPEETLVAAGPDNARVTYYRPFWRPVAAGVLFALSTFILSWFLMLGFHVGIEANGVLALGAGAAVWLWVTACVAYFFGGMIASAMTATPGEALYSYGSASLKGAVIWGASLPFALILYAFIAQYGGALVALNLPHPGITTSAVTNGAMAGPHLGFYWAMFIGLGLALICSIIGSISGCTAREAK
jgi:hypothetical protein